MKTEPMPHEKLTEEDVKVHICLLQTVIYKCREILEESVFREMDYRITALKRHFCPEKFSLMKVSVKELSEMIAEAPVDLPTMNLAFPSPLNNDGDKSRFLSEPRKMTRPDERKD